MVKYHINIYCMSIFTFIETCFVEQQVISTGKRAMSVSEWIESAFCSHFVYANLIQLVDCVVENSYIIAIFCQFSYKLQRLKYQKIKAILLSFNFCFNLLVPAYVFRGLLHLEVYVHLHPVFHGYIYIYKS